MPGQEAVIEPFLAALTNIDQSHADLYTDVALLTLSLKARYRLEALLTTVTYKYQSEFIRRYFDQGEAQGRAQGEARAVLTFVDARGIEVPADVRDTIIACADPEQLDLWVRRSVTADKVQDLFA